MSKIKLSDYIAKRLKEHYNVERIYLVPGGGAMHLDDSIGRYVNYVCNHHEQACAFAAEGQARVSGKPSVVCTTSGPGALNAVTGVFGQWTDSVPVIYISGQIKRETLMASYPDLKIRQIGDQEVDIISIVKSITKYAKCVTNPNEIKYHIDRAFYEATTGRKGPVWLDIPLDVQACQIEENDLLEFYPPQETTFNLHLDDVFEKLNKSKSPLIVAGHGIRLSEQLSTFRQFVDFTNIPVVTTFNGVDLIEDNAKQYVGRIGTIGQRAGNFAIQNADCVLFLGTRNNIRQVSYNWQSFADKACKIVVDIDKAELEKPTVKPDIAINADLKIFMPALLQGAKKYLKLNNLYEWQTFCKKVRSKYDYKNTSSYHQSGSTINPYYFMHKLFEYLSPGEIVVTGNGSACVCAFQTGVIKDNTRLFYNSGNATMGFDLPAAIGACFANSKKQVVAIAGDGSIMMNIQELQTIIHHNLPIKIFVINNDGYISMKQTQGNFFNGRLTGADSTSGITCPDFTKVGNAFGIKSMKIESPNDLELGIKYALSLNEPVICEVYVDKHYIFNPKLSSKKLPNGTMISSRLEDMFPFLDREEFNQNRL